MPRRAIVVVHGVGSQKKGETLNAIAEPLVRYLRRYLGPHALELDADLRPEHGPARATLRFQVGPLEEEWAMTEARWAEAFHPSPADPVMRWGFRILWEHTYSIVFGVFLRHLPWFPKRHYPPPTNPVYQDPPSSVAMRLWNVLVALAVAVIYLPAWLMVLSLASVFYLAAQLPSWLLVVGPAARLQRLLIEQLVNGVGDQQSMTSNPIARNAASRTVLRALAPHLDSRRDDYRYCETVTVVAHSGGCVVSHDALTDREIKAWSFRANGAQPTRVSWFTVGSGLNLAYRVAPHDPHWERTLDARIRWTDLWARYDPVPHGPVPPKLQRAVRGAHGAFESVRVVNRDNPFADHSEYWGNHEEVMSRLVYEVLGERPAGHPLWQRIAPDLQQEIVRHRRGVARFVWVRFGVALTMLGVAWAFDLAAWLGDRLLERIGPLAGAPFPIGAIDRWLAERPAFSVPFAGPLGANALLGLAILGIVSYLAYRLITLWFQGPLERRDQWH